MCWMKLWEGKSSTNLHSLRLSLRQTASKSILRSARLYVICEATGPFPRKKKWKKSVLNRRRISVDLLLSIMLQVFSFFDKRPGTKRKERQQESIRNGQDANLWEFLSNAHSSLNSERNSLQMCEQRNLGISCFTITLCPINVNGCVGVFRVSQVPDHVESQKFPLVTFARRWEIHIKPNIDTWISLIFLSRPSSSSFFRFSWLEIHFYLWPTRIYFLFVIN
jgi:hypothetical protein